MMSKQKPDELQCKKCGHEWTPKPKKVDRLPRECPGCKSRYWNGQRSK